MFLRANTSPCVNGASASEATRADSMNPGLVSARDFSEVSHFAHEHVFEKAESELVATWSRPDTSDAWRHARMYRCLDPILSQFPGANWLTVGDGRYGTDAHYLSQHGAQALATDICDLLLEKAKKSGFISAYKKENAERLTFANGTFDFALCKESYHHFPRPMLALYEMLRVVRIGAVFIEPDESPVLVGVRHFVKMLIKETMIRTGLGKLFSSRSTDIIDFGSNWYEEVGNFGFGISKREIERVALGLNFPHVAFRGINDAYVKGVEYETADEKSPLFKQIREQIAEMDRKCERGLNRSRHKLLVAIILKQQIDSGLRRALVAAGFEVRDLPRNPYLGDAVAKAAEKPLAAVS